MSASKNTQKNLVAGAMLFLSLIFFYLAPFVSYAQVSDYKPLSPLSNLVSGQDTETTVGTRETASYFQNAFRLALGIAGILAVLMIVVGGIQYMMSDAFTSKEEARSRITSALWGLLLLFASFIILNTINPALLNLDIRVPVLGPSAGSSLPPGQRQVETIATRTNDETIENFEKRCRDAGGTAKRGGFEGGFLRIICERAGSPPPPTEPPPPPPIVVGTTPGAPVDINEEPNIRRVGNNVNRIIVPADRNTGRCATYVSYSGNTYRDTERRTETSTGISCEYSIYVPR